MFIDVEQNVRRKVKEDAELTLTLSPAVECEQSLQNIKSADEVARRKGLFTIAKQLKVGRARCPHTQPSQQEPMFVEEFIKSDGVTTLVGIIMSFGAVESSNNTLAYALTAMQNLLDHDYDWSDLPQDLLHQMVGLLINLNTNICRAATGIIIKLINSEHGNYEAIQQIIEAERSTLPALVSRVADNDVVTQINTLQLINALCRKSMMTERPYVCTAILSHAWKHHSHAGGDGPATHAVTHRAADGE